MHSQGRNQPAQPITAAGMLPPTIEAPNPDNAAEQLAKRLNQLGPWRMNIQITDKLSTGDCIFPAGCSAGEIDPGNRRTGEREKFLKLIDTLYPNGLVGKRFLDCGCNAAGYCFWVRERKAEIGYGFDVRDHWIRQARFIKNQRTAGPTDRIQLEIMNLYDLSKKDLFPFDIVQFKGLFYHIPDPIGGLGIAADHSRDVLIFSSATIWGEADGSLKSVIDQTDRIHGGIERLNWFPTGPGVCAEIIRHLGFESVKLIKFKQTAARPTRGRVEIVAAREKGRLDDLPGETL